MPKTYYDSELTGEQIESALEAIDGVVTPSNNGKILRVKDGSIEAVSASEYTSGIDVEPLSVTANDTYTAPAGKAYSPVTVNVSGGGGGMTVDQLKTDTFGSINLTGTNNTGSTITAGTFFYNNGSLVRAKTDIQNGSTITIGTNAETVTAGGLNDLNNSLPQSKTSNVTNVHASANMRGSLILGKYGKIVSPFGYFQITNNIGTTQTLANIDDSSFYPNNVAFLSAIKTGTTTVSVISIRPNGTITTGDFSLTSGYYVVTGSYMTN